MLYVRDDKGNTVAKLHTILALVIIYDCCPTATLVKLVVTYTTHFIYNILGKKAILNVNNVINAVILCVIFLIHVFYNLYEYCNFFKLINFLKFLISIYFFFIANTIKN